MKVFCRRVCSCLDEKKVISAGRESNISKPLSSSSRHQKDKRNTAAGRYGKWIKGNVMSAAK